MATDMLNFYKNKKVFLTGGTGFLGKVLMEKLLRATEVQRIYILIRQKRGSSVKDRIDDLFNDPLFAALLKAKPEVNHIERVTPFYGDCALPNLGLSAADTLTLIEQVDIVVHGAATVRFNEPLSVAVAINVRATMDLIKLAKKMLKLKSFVHVSSAFANCIVSHIEERYYVDEIGIRAEKICHLLEQRGAEHVDGLYETLRGDYPNTYCLSKALAEDAVLTQAADLPICIFRPGIVIPTCKEPVPGWIDNLYGPTSITLGVAHGVLRVVNLRKNSNATIVPVDYCANVMLACAWRLAQNSLKKPIKPPIYNLVPDSSNLLKWVEYEREQEKHGRKMPPSRMAWYPFLILAESKMLYTFLSFFLHTLPGYLVDFALLLIGQKPRMVTIYRKIHKQIDMLEYFMSREWTFGMQNTNMLWHRLSAEDQAVFPFDMSVLDWSKYMYHCCVGMRLYLAKDDPSTIPKALKRMKRLLILHRTLEAVLFGGILLLIFRIAKQVFL